MQYRHLLLKQILNIIKIFKNHKQLKSTIKSLTIFSVHFQLHNLNEKFQISKFSLTKLLV